MPDNKTNILVIDDEEEIRELLKEFLEENHFNVTLAADGIEAQECIEESVPDIAVIDLLLPGEHGISLVKTIKEKYFIPVIMISCIYRREELKDLIEEYAVEGFLEKPLDLKILREKLTEIIDDRAV